MRIAEVTRNINETRVRVAINLDGTGKQTIDTGVLFLDHMLDQIARHGLIDLDIKAEAICTSMRTIPSKTWALP